MRTFQASDWSEIEAIRSTISRSTFHSVEEAAQTFAGALDGAFASTALARVFLILPWGNLPPDEKRFALAASLGRRTIVDTTPVLTLLGTAGREPAWRDRRDSVGHRAIPLLDASFVQGVPMIAKLLADLDVSFATLDIGGALDTRALMGGLNKSFCIDDARTTSDSLGRRVVPNRAFVEKHALRTVFGMGGAYVDGTLAVAIVFTSETVDRLVVNRFPSLIGNFKMATGELLARGHIFQHSPP